MTKLLFLTALMMAPAIVPNRVQTDRVDKMAEIAKAELAKCEAPVNIEFCSITITIQGWETKDSKPKVQHKLFSSHGAPTAKFDSSGRY